MNYLKIKHCIFLIIGCGLILSSSCSTTNTAKSSKEEAKACVFFDSPNVAAPEWVCNLPTAKDDLFAIGVSEKSRAGYNFMKQMAVSSARIALAQRLQVRVQNMIKQYVSTTGVASSETVDKVNTSVTKLITDTSLRGSYASKSITSPLGSLYVLVILDSNHIKQIAQQAIASSMNNDSALWQEFKADKAQQDLAASIAATKVSP